MNKHMKFYALLITLVFLLVGVVLAATPIEPLATDKVETTAVPAAPEDPIKMLENISNNVLRALKTRNNQKDLKGIYTLVDQYILPYVDFNEMSQWVAGRTIWNKASQQTRTEFMDAFKILVVRTYATALNSYTNERIEFAKQNIDVKKERIQIRSLIVRQGQNKEDIRLDYRLIKHDNKWYVYDIIIEGVSILQGFQAQFSSDIRQNGLQKVIAQIQAHNKETNV